MKGMRTMKRATIGILALLAGAATLAACANDQSNSAMAHGTGAAATAAMPTRVDNFMLVDQNLEAHELYRLGDAPAIVLVTQQKGDAVTQKLAPQINKIAADYGAKRVEFMMINSSMKDSMESIQAEATKVGYKVPVLMDDKQIIGEGLGVTRSAEAIVINPKTWQVAWRGSVGGRPAALGDVLAGKPAAAGAASTGAAIAFAGATKVSYSKDVAPILEAKCVACHEEGGIGPLAFNNYAMVKGFAPMIREVIRTDRMPPYHADPRVGHFSDDKRLTPQEVKTLVNWVEQGAPRGDGT